MNIPSAESALSNFTPDEQTALTNIFHMFDKDQDGLLSKKEVVDIAHTLGVTELTEEDYDSFLYCLYSLGYTNLQINDLGEDKKISFVEFLEIINQIKIKEGSLQISSFIKDIEKANIKKENEFISKNPEKAAYINIINNLLSNEELNNNYLPIDPYSNDIFDKIKDGILLCKFINKAKKDTIDERTINKNENMTEFQQRQNLNLAISAAKSIGLRCGDITSEIIIEKSNLSSIMKFIGEICHFLLLHNINLRNYPELVNILNKNEEITELLKYSPEQILLKWFNYHLKAAGYEKPINNFSEDIKDSEKYIILLNHLNKEICDKDALNESDIKKRAEIVLSNISKLNINSFIKSNDIVDGNGKLNVLLVGSIFNSNIGLNPLNEKQKKEINNVLADEDEGEEKIYRIWINSLNLKDEKEEDIIINNVYEESKDGLLLLRIIDKLKSGVVKWKVVDKKPKNVFKKNINCNEVIDSCKKLKFNIVGIGGSDIREGRKKYILSIVWQMMKMHSLQIIGNKTEDDLVKWGNEKVDENIRIKNLKDKKLGNSLFFINIIKYIDPNVINLDIIEDKNDEESKKNNAKNCISAARKLGAIVLLEWKDIVKVKSNLLLTFLASIYNVAQNYEKKE